MNKLINLRHPHYMCMATKWAKWRLVFAGGDDFVDSYLSKYSEREDDKDFERRKCMSPAPCFAKAAVIDVKNNIFQRTAAITRRGGSKSYQDAVAGRNGGVDGKGSTMNSFMGSEILPELLSMAKVGVFVDMPPIYGPSKADAIGKRPYLYTYHAEDILSWRDKNNEFDALLLCDHLDDCCPITHLPHGLWCRYRYIWREDGVVKVRYYNDDCKIIGPDGVELATDEPFILNLKKIPFVVGELSDSLLSDTAGAQIALLNMDASDVAYVQKSNAPFYTEQQEFMAWTPHGQGPATPGDKGTAAEANAGGKSREIRVGATQGRFYGKGLERPGFIHPSSEPLRASMDKQKALKDDIRQLINLALSNIKPKMASAESKAIDERGLESGLSYIGLELERMEREIAAHWAALEGSTDVAVVAYPQKYSLQSDEDRRSASKHAEEMRSKVPSPTFQKEMSKEMVVAELGHKLSTEEMDQIIKEIDSAQSITVDPDFIFAAVEKGLLDLKLAAKLLGLPEDAPELAAADHAERLARIAVSQAARGVPDLSGSPVKEGADEKAASRDTTQDDRVEDKTRGEGK